MRGYISKLMRCPLFNELKPHEIEKLIEMCDYRVGRYKEGNVIRNLSEDRDEILVILEGEVKTEFQSKEGKILQIERLEGHDVLALGAVFSQTEPLPINVIALSDVLVLCLKRSEKRRCVETVSNKQKIP